MGLSDELIEMLFVHPDEQGKGYGKRLMEYARDKKHMDKVDVNEQNEKHFSSISIWDSKSSAEMKRTAWVNLSPFFICNCRKLIPLIEINFPKTKET